MPRDVRLLSPESPMALVTCPHCLTTLKAPNDPGQRTVPCPNCGSTLRVPERPPQIGPAARAGAAAAPRETGPLIPPEEKFWQRYSPHNEAPLSGASSFLLHMALLSLLALVCWLGSRASDSNKSIPVGALAVAGPEGGGGDPGGQADGGPGARGGRGAPETPAGARAPRVASPKIILPVVKPEPLAAPELNADTGRAVVDASEAWKSLERLDKNLREKLVNGLGGGANARAKGRGGPGTGGGKDKG